MGYREQLILQKRTNKGVANYPAVSITALSINEKQSLLLNLEKLKKQNIGK
jgi:hypothetical protein